MDHFDPQVLNGLCLFVASTFGNGDHPNMAGKMAEWLDEQLTKHIEEKQALLGHGSRRGSMLEPSSLATINEESHEKLTRQASKKRLSRVGSIMTRHNNKSVRRGSCSSELECLK